MKNAARSPIALTRAAWLRLALGVLIGLAGPAIQAQPDPGPPQGEPADPPARVARVADVIGDAWLFDEENKEWTRLLRNQTIAEGDRLRTDDHARVALSAGSTSLWLDERSDLLMDRLDEGSVQLQLDRGDLAVQVRSPDAASDLRVYTHQGQLRPERDGLYRIEQLDRGTLARTWQGRLRFDPDSNVGGAGPSWVEAGEQVEFWWAEGPRAERQRMVGDSFGDWVVAQSRNEGGLSASTQRFVSPEMTGSEDLDRYGSWDQAPDYGPVWFPAQVAVDWAPYRYGHWAWTRYWGWAWVDDSPWGFAPFHYGRWVQYRGRWGWTPGAYVARPVYAPALVAFVGGGGSVGFGVSIGIGGRRPPPPNRGWVPLAPREAFIPAYRHTDTYVRRLNNARDVKPIQTPRNFSVSGAVSFPQPNRPQAQQQQRRSEAEMQQQWRGSNGGGRDRDRDRGDNSNNNRWQGQRPQVQPQPQQQGRPAPQVQPQAQQQLPQQQRNDDRNDRNDRGRNRDFEQQRAQQPQQQQQAPVAQPQVQRPQEQVQQQQQQQQRDAARREQQEQRDQQRERNDAERFNHNNESRGRGGERQRQPEVQQQPQQQVQQPQQPRPQAPPPQAQPQQQRQQQSIPAQPQAQQPKNEDKSRDRKREEREH
ncbi:MAG TPA: DUF6600 domain-containing protein [Burkholderiaceae bacterium]|jgi:hypothetical protein